MARRARRPSPSCSHPARRALPNLEQLECRDLLDAAFANVGQQLLAQYHEADQVVHIEAVVDDPSFPSQWALNNTGQSGGTVDADIDAPEAWDITRGSSRTVVGIIDTGIDYRHRDLYRNIWINQGEIPADIRARLLDLDSDGRITFWDLNDARNQGSGKIIDLNNNARIDGGDLLFSVAQGGWANGASDDGDLFVDDLIGWDFVNNDNNPLDDNDHGTHIAGVIGATSNDAIGIAGINQRVGLMAVKAIAANGIGSSSLVLSAFDYAVQHGAQISNHSYAGSDYSQAMASSLDAARAKGHIAVVAAGNGDSDFIGDNIDTAPSYPASYNLANVVTVAATTRTDSLAVFSNFGKTTVDLGAPGREILSTTRNDGYKTFSGTSMATPHAVGVLALVYSQHPTWKYYQVIDQVLATTDPINALKDKTVTGGRLNAFRAVSEVRSDRQGAYVVSAVANGSGAQSISRLRVTFSEGMRTANFTASDVVYFAGPQGSIAVSSVQPVANSDDRSFDILFAPQTTPGTYKLQLGVVIPDLAGNNLDQDRDGINGESTQDRFTTTFTIQPTFAFTNNSQMSIRDLTTNISSLTIDRDVTIGDLNLQLNLKHTFDNDLYIHLRGPDGTDVILSNRRGGSGDNYTNTALDDETTKLISTGAAPFTGVFRPESALSAFDGKNARGTWQLWIEDRQRGDSGTLLSWSLIIEQAPSTTVATTSVKATSVPDAQLIKVLKDADSAATSHVVDQVFIQRGRNFNSRWSR